MVQSAIKINYRDNVAVAIVPLVSGQTVTIDSKSYKILQDIPAGHKFALADLEAGTDAIKYGHSIGIITQTVRAGEWIHTHNLKTGLENTKQYHYRPEDTAITEWMNQKKENEGKQLPRWFDGYRREDGTVGIRNDIYIIPTVGCVNDIVRELEKKGQQLIADKSEDVIAFTHPYGCSQLGEDQLNTQKILAGLIKHPNAGGVLVIGLGCENNNIDEMKKILGNYNCNRVKFLVCQETEDEISQGLELLKELVKQASEDKRVKIEASELVIGLKCGGSDGFSGITANPVVGAFSDRLITYGATAILTEVPEMFGAETILMNRCIDKIVFHKLVKLINDFRQYFIHHDQPVYENPSPGNKKGGISTLEDKSLGCTQKSGRSPVCDVLDYGEHVKEKGLILLSAPGNDLVASTALAASGAHLILFTTGRGTPFGSPVPTIKISSNSLLAMKKKNWIDFDAGRLLELTTVDELADELYQLVIETASGKKAKSEEAGYHELAIFKQGVTL